MLFAGDAAMLPAAGLLSFFYDAEQEARGFDPQHRNGWRVLYSPEDAALARRELPAAESDNARYPPCGLSFAEELTTPDPGIDDLLRLASSEEQANALWDDLFDRKYEGDDLPRHRTFGYADEAQGAIGSECQPASHGIYVGEPDARADSRARELAAGAKHWLLLQVDTDEDSTGMCWGDAGRIYFWIERAVLARPEFGRAWAILRCS